MIIWRKYLRFVDGIRCAVKENNLKKYIQGFFVRNGTLNKFPVVSQIYIYIGVCVFLCMYMCVIHILSLGYAIQMAIAILQVSYGFNEVCFELLMKQLLQCLAWIKTYILIIFKKKV